MAEKKQSFEAALAELEAVAQALESGELDLDATVKAFEKGIKLSKQCSDTLERAKQKIEKINLEASGENV